MRCGFVLHGANIVSFSVQETDQDVDSWNGGLPHRDFSTMVSTLDATASTSSTAKVGSKPSSPDPVRALRACEKEPSMPGELSFPVWMK